MLTELNLTVRIMPRDVSTRWNSTFDMLDFAIEYRKAIDTITDRRRLGLGAFVLSDEEWVLAKQLCEVLRVSHACDMSLPTSCSHVEFHP